MGDYTFKQVIIRIKYNTFLRLKRVFPARRKESAADYFERLAQYLEEQAGLRF